MQYRQKELLARASKSIFGTRSAWKKRFDRGVLYAGDMTGKGSGPRIATTDDAVFYLSHEFLVRNSEGLSFNDEHLLYAALVVGFTDNPPFVLWFADEVSKNESLNKVRDNTSDELYSNFENHLNRMSIVYGSPSQNEQPEGKLIIDGMLFVDCLRSVISINNFNYRSFICELGEKYLLAN
jgi:hypothetical protein